MDSGSSAASTPEVYVTEEGWWALRSRHELGGRIYLDGTERMTPGNIDLSVISVKGASAAVAISHAGALALAQELVSVVVGYPTTRAEA